MTTASSSTAGSPACSSKWPVHVAWRNIERITTDERGLYWVKYHYLHITLRSLKPPNSGYAQRVTWNPVVQRVMGYNAKLGTARFAFANWVNTTPGDEIVAQVRERFALELKRYDIHVRTDSEFRQMIANFRAMHPKSTDGQ